MNWKKIIILSLIGINLIGCSEWKEQQQVSCLEDQKKTNQKHMIGVLEAIQNNLIHYKYKPYKSNGLFSYEYKPETTIDPSQSYYGACYISKCEKGYIYVNQINYGLERFMFVNNIAENTKKVIETSGIFDTACIPAKKACTVNGIEGSFKYTGLDFNRFLEKTIIDPMTETNSDTVEKMTAADAATYEGICRDSNGLEIMPPVPPLCLPNQTLVMGTCMNNDISCSEEEVTEIEGALDGRKVLDTNTGTYGSCIATACHMDYVGPTPEGTCNRPPIFIIPLPF